MNFNEYPVDSLMYITNRPEIVFTRGLGSWLYDNTGKRYLDFIQGWAVNSLGHCNEGMIEALTSQARTLINPSPAFYNVPMAQLAGLLTAHSCFDRVFFANSGPKPTKARSSSPASGARSSRTARTRSSPSITASTAARSRRCPPAARPAGTRSTHRRCRASRSRSERHRFGRKAHQREDRRRDARAYPGRRRRDSRDARVHAATARADEET